MLRIAPALLVGSALVVTLAACGAPSAPTASAARPAPSARTSAAATHDPAVAAAATADALHAVAVGEIRAELGAYYADFSARNWPAFAGHFWPGATITTIRQPEGEAVPRVVVTSLPDFVAQAPNGPDSKAIFEERITGAETKIEDDLAQVWSHYTARFGDPGAVEEWTGVDSFTLMKQDGTWKIVALAFTNEQ